MEEWTICQLQAMMRAGELTARELVRMYLERIALIDCAGPRLNAIIELNPDALAIAEGLDRERAEGKTRGPLHGIPVILKDNIDTADRMMTTAGSLALEGSIAPQDSTVAANLRAAGAVILGKANLSEWANFRSTHSVSGWSSRGGQTRNPYALDRSPCGSSSGSGVAVAANLCAAAVGTETDGSVICPSQTNGIVGIKPTLGLISRAGIIPIAHSQDTAGPMARTVADAAIMLGAMVGQDPRDPASMESAGKGLTDYTAFLTTDVKGMRVGVARGYFGISPKVDVIIESGLKVLESLGVELVDITDFDAEKKLNEARYEIEVLLYEFKADLNAYLSSLGPGAPVHSMEEIIAFNDANQDRAMPFFGQERMRQALEKGPLTEEAYLKALENGRRLAREEGIDKVLKEQHVEAIIAPTGDPAWLVDFVNGDLGGGVSCTTLPAVAGYPHITVPAGLINGLPVGISFFSTAWSEPVLIRLAYAYEQATQARCAPTFLSTVQV